MPIQTHLRALLSAATLLALAAAPAQTPSQAGSQTPSQPTSASPSGDDQITIDTHARTTPFPHFWEQTFGSGRAVLALRQSYRDDIRSVREATGFREVRFHGIFNDDVGLYDPNATTQNPGLAAEQVKQASPYNFSYVDQIYDGLLDAGVRPFVELSFMPRKMAADPNQTQSFFYRPVVSPPRNYADWDAMIGAFAQHLIARYGIEEVTTWRFEVWNEPNLDFWGGRPNMPTYFELYDHTARALKQVSSRLLVGGPSTAQAAFVTAFLEHCKQNGVPVDFASTHVYGNDLAKDVFNTNEVIPRDQMVYRAVKKVHEEIAASPFPAMPLLFSEYNASYANEPNVTDTIYMGPWLANNISLCDGLTVGMSYWSFSDVFEEQGVVKTPFYGGFGIIAEDNIPKPAYNAFAMLHQLGDQRIAVRSGSALATRTVAGDTVVALWNYAPPFGEGPTYTPPPSTPGPSRHMTVQFTGISGKAAVEIERLDSDHGNVVKLFDSMGRPDTPSRAQIVQLRAAARPTPAEHAHLADGKLTLEIPPQGLVLLKLHSR